MGLAASQARWLQLVARKSDLEFRGQMINQRRIMLSQKSMDMERAYTDYLDHKVIRIRTVDPNTGEDRYEKMTAAGLTNVNMRLQDQNGRTVDPGAVNEGYTAHMLNTGQWKLTYINDNETTGKKAGETVEWQDNPSLAEVHDTSQDSLKAAKHDTEAKKLQLEDKRLEMELKNIDTEHKAIETEIEAVKKVIDKNIESSFKTFG